MNDSAVQTTRPASAPLRFFHVLLRILRGFLAIATALAIPLAVISLTGRGTPTYKARIDAPFEIKLDARRSVTVEGDGLEFRGYPNDSAGERFFEDPTLNAKVRVGRHDTDTRVALEVFLAAMLALCWVGLVNLLRIVRAARDGDPFDARNAIRLRWVAGAVLMSAVVVRVIGWVLDSTIDAPVPVHTAVAGPGWLFLLTLGLGLFALAECFRAGAELRELEQATI